MTVLPELQVAYLNMVFMKISSYKMPSAGNSILLSPYPNQRVHLALGRTPVEEESEEEILSLLRWALPILLSVMSTENILQILGYLMVEVRVIVVCEDIQLLTGTVIAVTSLLRPLHWAGPIIPVLPPSLYEYLEVGEAFADSDISLIFLGSSPVCIRCTRSPTKFEYYQRCRPSISEA